MKWNDILPSQNIKKREIHEFGLIVFHTSNICLTWISSSHYSSLHSSTWRSIKWNNTWLMLKIKFVRIIIQSIYFNIYTFFFSFGCDIYLLWHKKGLMLRQRKMRPCPETAQPLKLGGICTQTRGILRYKSPFFHAAPGRIMTTK